MVSTCTTRRSGKQLGVGAGGGGGAVWPGDSEVMGGGGGWPGDSALIRGRGLFGH